MFEYRQVLTLMRLGDTDRAIARAGLMGRRKARELRRAVKASSVSLAEPFRDQLAKWWGQGIQGTTIHAALVRRHGFKGSYSSVRRFVHSLDAAHPRATTVLEFDPGEAA